MNLERVFYLGSHIQYLRLQRSLLSSVHGETYILGSFEEILDTLKIENINDNLIDDIIKMKDFLIKKYPEDKYTQISKEDANNLRDKILQWRQTIINELNKKLIVDVQLKSGFDLNELTKLSKHESSEFIPKEIWEKLTDIERSDYADAAKCLILDTATPSVMVALRGAEASIRNFYQHKTQSDPGNKTWRQLTNELKDKFEELNIKNTFVGFLDYIGDAKRNFAQHPNKIYTIREAAVIFMQVIAMVEDIYSQI